MIIGIGTDIVENSRIGRSLERFGTRFLQKIFTFDEAADNKSVQQLAARFAAKEAAAKALGTGFSQGIGLKDIEILSLTSGQTQVKLNKQALKRAESLGVKNIHLSISHEKDFSVAFVIMEA